MDNREKSQKKSYEKPIVKRFGLRPEEAVLGFCKSPSINGPSTMGGFCNPVSCQTSGS